MTIIVNFQLWLFCAFSSFFTAVYGNCQFDQRCFRYSVGCTLAHAYPYDRTIGISCTECLNRCLMQQNSPPPYCCRSVVYDGAYGTCDLFAVNAMFPPQRLMKWRGRCYFQPTGYCQISKPAPPPPPPTPQPTPSCPSGQTAKLVAIKNYQFSGMTGTTVPNVDQKGCEQACLKNQLPDGKPIDCKMAQFSGGKCVIATSQSGSAENSIQPSSGTTFYQKLCFPTSSVANCPDVFEEDPQKILVGQNKQTVDSPNLQDCLQKCLDSQKNYGFVCKSGMFFYQDTSINCILNIESKSTKPDLFTDSSDKVTYFEPGCNGGQKFAVLAAKKRAKQMDFLKDQPIKGDWTLWSPCGAKNKQYRFLQCEKFDPRQCKKQEKPCADLDKITDDDHEEWFKIGASKSENAISDGNATSSFTPCKAFFRNGNRNCTFGTQVVDGDIIYCTNPLDC